MRHHLPPHISFALVADRAVLLDLSADRYLMCGRAETEALSVPGAHAAGPILDRLVARRLVGFGPGAPIAPVAAPSIGASAQELEWMPSPIGLLEAAAGRAGAAASLRWRGLAATVARFRSIRAGYDMVAASVAPEREDGRSDEAVRVAQGYDTARLWVPARRLCIPDSLALARILWRRGITVDIYFGVQLGPFTAHCWVQRGALLLSDPLDRVAEFTPVFRL